MVIKRQHGRFYLEKLNGVGWMLTSILVDEDYRGQGIGSEMLQEALKKCGRPVLIICHKRAWRRPEAPEKVLQALRL